MGVIRLGDSTALRIFELYTDGVSITEIMRRLSVGKNAILAHLRREYQYSPKVESKIAAMKHYECKPSISPPDGYISLRQARYLVPFFPSDTMIYAIARQRNFRTKMIGTRRVTTPEWVRRFVDKTFGELPQGIAILENDIDLITLDELTTIDDSFRLSIRKSRKQLPLIMLWSVREICENQSIRFEIPPTAYRNALMATSLGASFVLLSRRMFLRSTIQ